MKETSEYVLALQQLNRRMDNIEKLMNMLLLNDLIDDVEITADDAKYAADPYLQKLLKKYNLDMGEQERIGGINIVYIIMPEHTGVAIGDVISLNQKFKERYTEIQPVFKYETINGMHRKRLMQERISFCVNGREIRIYGSKKQK